MKIKNWIIKKALTGGLPKWVYRFLGRKLAEKIQLKEGVMDSKKWYQSKTILSNVVTVLLGVYALLQTNLAPDLGWNLPNVPEWVLIFLGSLGIYGRKKADTIIE